VPHSKALRVAYLNFRSASGNAMAEFAPALIVLLICIFFPLVDMLAVGLAYCDAQVLNTNQVHEASLLD
jgi:Flp pilus assembly protein TadG